jgi:transcriptional regulator with XRE-family HTH domain
MDYKQIGSQIMKYRKQKGFTQESLAEILQITPQAISKWENGITLPDSAILIDLSNALDTSIDDILLQYNKNVRARYEITLLPYKKVGTYCGAAWPRSMSDASMLAALKLFMGLERNMDNIDNQINNDGEYILQAAITNVAFGFSYTPTNQLKDAFLIYGLDYDRYYSRDLSEQQMIQLAKIQIEMGYPVIVEPVEYIDKIFATGYIDNGKILKGLSFLEGDDTKNSFIDFSKLTIFNEWYKNECSLLLIKLSDKRLSVKDAMIMTIIRGYNLLSKSETYDNMPLKGHGLIIYDNWVKLLQDENRNNIKELNHLFPHTAMLYENKLRIKGFLEQCIVVFNDLLTQELEHAIKLYEIICNFSIEILKIQENQNMQENDVNEKRIAIINYLNACKGNEERIIQHFNKFIVTNNLK